MLQQRRHRLDVRGAVAVARVPHRIGAVDEDVRHGDGRGALWRTKKSHFQASVEMGMKNVDKDAVNTTIGLFCYLDA